MKSELDLKKTFVSILLIIVLLVLAGIIYKYLEANRNVADSVEVVPFTPAVEIIVTEYTDYPVKVKTSGQITATKEVNLAAEINGKLIKVSPRLKVGNRFTKGEFIAQIDPSDYQSALANSHAAIADAKLIIIQEKARAKLGIKEWSKLGKGAPSELVARIPQLERAEANLLAAEADLNRAERNLKRTEIVAPFEMQVESNSIASGSFVTPGMILLSARSSTELEVNLQIPMDSYFLLENKDAEAKLVAKIGTKELRWSAQFSRSKGSVNQETLSLPVIYKILENTEQPDFALPPVGLYVNAELVATTLKKKIVIPRNLVKPGGNILIVSSDNLLEIRKLKVIFTDENIAVIEGVEPGERIVTSPMETPINGMKVSIAK